MDIQVILFLGSYLYPYRNAQNIWYWILVPSFTYHNLGESHFSISKVQYIYSSVKLEIRIATLKCVTVKHIFTTYYVPNNMYGIS